MTLSEAASVCTNIFQGEIFYSSETETSTNGIVKELASCFAKEVKIQFKGIITPDDDDYDDDDDDDDEDDDDSEDDDDDEDDDDKESGKSSIKNLKILELQKRNVIIV